MVNIVGNFLCVYIGEILVCVYRGEIFVCVNVWEFFMCEKASRKLFERPPENSFYIFSHKVPKKQGKMETIRVSTI